MTRRSSRPLSTGSDLQTRKVGPAEYGPGGPLEENSVVALSSPIELEDGRVLAPGAKGAIVGIWRKGAAYEIEFNDPFHVVVTVPRESLRHGLGASD